MAELVTEDANEAVDRAPAAVTNDAVTPHPGTSAAPSTQVVNVPNGLSFLRLLAALGVGLLIEWGWYLTAIITFLIAASTDFLDGWWARRFNQVTKLGRILDPFVDKIIVSAALIALVGVPASQVPAWLVTVVIGRELLVTSLRAMVEGRGGDFSALWMGKLKMGVQCAAIVASLLLLYSMGSPYEAWLRWSTIGLLWLALAITIGSGWEYVLVAIKLNSPK
jgi:CDP-diacylglycerol---glycerol-3-phosphate 3-phosphatidyltransferase